MTVDSNDGEVLWDADPEFPRGCHHSNRDFVGTRDNGSGARLGITKSLQCAPVASRDIKIIGEKIIGMAQVGLPQRFAKAFESIRMNLKVELFLLVSTDVGDCGVT
jgi:hypothetical protein